MSQQKHILFAPLDWGLGHTTRSVPIIRYLIEKGCRVSVAGNEWQRQYIENTFHGIHTIHLDGYNVWYSKNGSGFLPALMMQLPRLTQTIIEEHNWLKHAVEKFGFSGVITDNRYGLYHASIPNVIITHQVAPQTGWGFLPDSVLRTLHDKRLSCFNDCWIVDAEHGPNLAGSLSRPSVMPSNAKYIGLLSQHQHTTVSEEHLLVLLSGPEPQRGMLSDLLWWQLKNYAGKIVFVEGSDNVPERVVPANVVYHKRLTADTLTPLLAAASMVICRSGYSSLMDLLAMNKKAIIIPTPGQAEQEYLGKYLHEQDVFYCAHQKHLDIMASLNNTQHFPYKKPETKNVFEQFKTVVDAWVEKI